MFNNIEFRIKLVINKNNIVKLVTNRRNSNNFFSFLYIKKSD